MKTFQGLCASLLIAGHSALSTTSCSDLSSDSNSCLTHKDLVGALSCTWCVTDSQCHAVGSLENPCSNACCVSSSSLSTCEYENINDVNEQACNGTWSVRTFAPGSDVSTTQWPEKGRTSGAGTALHFSGGGSRAMTMGVSQVRGLYQLNMMQAVEYLVGVSGGAWFASAFTYDQTPYTDDVRLCPYVEPGNLTDDFLNDVPEGCMLSAPQCKLFECVAAETAKSVVPGNKLDRIWIDCVHHCYLDPFNIGRSDLYTYQDSDVSDIKARNPNLEDEHILLPSTGGYRPYMILAGTVIGPQDLGSFKDANRTFVPVELSSLGSGVAHEQTINYDPVVGDITPVKVGGLVEAFGFGQVPLGPGIITDDNNVGEGYVAVSAQGDNLFRNGIAFSAAVSSMAPEALFSEYGPKSDYTLIGGEVYPAEEGNRDYNAQGEGNHTYMLLGDGGDLENFGLFSSLRRRIPRAAVFVNCDVSLNMSWDPATRPPTSDDVDGYMSSLFGLQVFAVDNDMYDTFNNQVFDTADFAPLIYALQAGLTAGTGAVATTSLTTIENKFMGIPAGIDITITWNYLTMPSNWFNQLPTNIQDDINKGMSGPYPGFPNYSVFHLGLSAAQVNLLANLGTWVMFENKEQYQNLL